jgi:serine protease
MGLSEAGNMADPSSTSPFVNHPTTNRIIVKYKSYQSYGSVPDSAANLVEQFAGVDSVPVKKTFNGAYVIHLNEERSLEQMQVLSQGLEQTEGIEYAEPDLIMYPLMTPNDNRYSEQWHYYEETGGIGLPSAWDQSQGTNIVVAVLDTGYRPHTDLSPNLLPGYDMISSEFVSNDGDGRDADPIDPGDYHPECKRYLSSWHGTHVAGTIAAVTNNERGVAGVAFNAKVVPVRVIGRCGGYLSDIMDGVAWAAGVKLPELPVNQNPAQVINLSLGSRAPSCPQTAIDAIETVRQRGATVIAAVGNKSESSSGIAPANCPGVIGVAASDRNADLADFSNFGDEVDLAAPGVEVLSTHNNGIITADEESYRSMSGSSMATPHVSGVAALLYSLKPEITPNEVEQLLVQSTRPFNTPCTGCGSGILDANAAITLLQPEESSLILLKNGIAQSGLSAGPDNSLKLAIDVPEGVRSLTIKSAQGTGDSDLYVRFEAEPSFSEYDCRPYLNGNEESCVIRPVKPGRYYIMVHAYKAFSNVRVLANYMLKGTLILPDMSYQNFED